LKLVGILISRSKSPQELTWFGFGNHQSRFVEMEENGHLFAKPISIIDFFDALTSKTILFAG
jgi:hypothetical protein